MNLTGNFLDLFSGCGGLSLGLMKSGWTGILAIEQSQDASKTIKHNLLDKGHHNEGQPSFKWPMDIKMRPYEIADFKKEYWPQLRKLRGQVDLIVGGPPCQGFSFAGKRNKNDPRNELFKHHTEIVELIQPYLVLMENVMGIDIAFGGKKGGKKKQRGRPRKSYASRIQDTLEKSGYRVHQHVIKALDFGVPQLRPRFFTLGIRNDIVPGNPGPSLEGLMRKKRNKFLMHRNIPIDRPVTVSEAISDLCTEGKILVKCNDNESPNGYLEIEYQGPLTYYQELMQACMNGLTPNSLRLVNHRPETVERFKRILNSCRKGVQLSSDDRKRFGIKKTSITPLAPDQPSHTLTTLPDDLLHYSEPRILTVREYARLQSFPDWFEFRGKFTTGGQKRVVECPRYTQVGNAVPPLLAELLGEVLFEMMGIIGENRFFSGARLSKI